MDLSWLSAAVKPSGVGADTASAAGSGSGRETLSVLPPPHPAIQGSSSRSSVQKVWRVRVKVWRVRVIVCRPVFLSRRRKRKRIISAFVRLCQGRPATEGFIPSLMMAWHGGTKRRNSGRNAPKSVENGHIKLRLAPVVLLRQTRSVFSGLGRSTSFCGKKEVSRKSKACLPAGQRAGKTPGSGENRKT